MDDVAKIDSHDAMASQLLTVMKWTGMGSTYICIPNAFLEF